MTFGIQGYRDELCSLIEKVVRHATMQLNETICIDFDNRFQLRIPVASYMAPGERAIWTGPKHFLFVF